MKNLLGRDRDERGQSLFLIVLFVAMMLCAFWRAAP